MKLVLAVPSRSSGGGNNFVDNLLSALREIGTDPITVGSQNVDELNLLENDGRTVSVWPGSVCRSVPEVKSVFWPLNVEPLEPVAYKWRHSRLRGRARLVALRSRLAKSAGAADATVFGSAHAQSLYFAAFDTLRDKPSVVIRGGAASIDPQMTGSVPPAWAVGTTRFLFVSHLYPYKGVLELLDAFRIVVDRAERPVALDIVGAFRDRRYERAVRMKVERLSLDQSVAFRGLGSPAELAGYYSATDVFVFPSLVENAGSFAVFDALHRGIPTICSSRSSLPEVVGNSTIQIEPSDSAAFANAMLLVAENATARRVATIRARTHAVTALSWRQRACILHHFCEELVDK